VDTTYIVIAIAIIAAFLMWYVIATYNGLIERRNQTQSAWSDIDVQLKRRHDLIPNLVETARGYMAHERATLEAVTKARTEAMSLSGASIATRAVAEMALTGAVGNLFAVSEKYPALRAVESFTLLQEQLTSTENRIAFARQHYNETVRQLNTSIAEFPRNALAGLFGFTPAAMFAGEAGDRANAQVKI
jgi:LemA protein